MKRWRVYVAVACLLSLGMYGGYKVLERLIIQKELQADIAAERDFVSSVEATHFSPQTKQTIANLANEHIAQLGSVASVSKSYKQFRQQKARLLETWAQEDELETILAKEQK